LTPVSALPGRVAQLILPLRDEPGAAAVLCDIDGTLAPIVADPGDAIVPEGTRRALRAVARRFGLVACVSGRRAVEARWLVGVDELTYAGNHGLEVLEPGAATATPDPALADRVRAARGFVLDLEADAVGQAGIRIEDKGPIQALHWRGAGDPEAAERRAREIAAAASAAGLEPRFGRKVLEIRPTAEVDKGTTVRRLLDGRRLKMALFAGDDRTDLDAFRALRSIVAEGDLRAAVCIGISSDEAPPELATAADAIVPGPEAFRDVLTALAEPRARTSTAIGG
jgi:trehalose 6-phosphate phosphatase